MDALRLIDQLSQYKTKSQIAKELGIDESTIRRWIHGDYKPKGYIIPKLEKMLEDNALYLTNNPSFTFIDLFAGIGGIRKAFEDAGGKCVYTCELDPYAQRTYIANYKSDNTIVDDITEIKDYKKIPDHDILLAGFPCQPFSIAGVSKKNSLGRHHGFEDKVQGTLFFNLASIISAKKPKVFILENVKNLRSHDKGKTYEIIKEVLEQDLKYTVFDQVIDGQHFVPQHRERLIFVGFSDKAKADFSWNNLLLPEKGLFTMNSILHRTDGSEPFLPHDGDKYFDHKHNSVLEKYTISDKLWDYLQKYAIKHRNKGNGFGFGLVGDNSVSRTLSARYYKDGSEILVEQGPDKNPRRLTPRECARLMGYEDSFKIPVSDTRAYKQFGNSVVVPVFRKIADLVVPLIKD